MELLTPEEARVAGCLVEKQMATPEYYPLTMNSLITACNQSSNRNPVVNYDEQTVQAAVDGLKAKQLARSVMGQSSRVLKFRHMLDDTLQLSDGELALVAVLLLRGQQTLAELKARTERLHAFSSINAVEQALDDLARRDPPLVRRIDRMPGQKEDRYAQLLTGDPPASPAPRVVSLTPAPALEQRVAALEAQVAALRAIVDEIKTELYG